MKSSRPRMLGSLRLRLLAGTLAWILVSVGLAGWGLASLFRQHITQQLQAELTLHLNQLTAAVNVDADGRPSVDPPLSDPRLEQPLSGLYWQVDRLADGGRPAAIGVARSRSLWDQTLKAPTASSARDPAGASQASDASVADASERASVRDGGNGNPSGDQAFDIAGPAGRDLAALARVLKPAEDNAPPLRLIVAADRRVLAEPIGRFNYMLAMALGALAIGLTAAAVVQVVVGLRPLARLRQQLASQHAGGSRIEGRFPSEIQPLVDDFNKVLAMNAEIVQRARTQAGNLAHAVKTPLTILSNAASRDANVPAPLVQEQVAMANRQIDYHLARARAAASSGAADGHAPLQAAAEGLVRVMQRLYTQRALRITMEGFAPTQAIRGEPQDLQEMLGNLLDNACKWARSQVRMSVEAAGEGRWRVHIDDDGPGIDDHARERIFLRGVRMDEQQPGSGLGLDIVRDLANTYGGDVRASPSPLGGLRVSLTLPQA
ncbi:histidine kinase [Achromobacter piechaudii]|uniref:sensor histidine kinase n=1 Tax=Achromobacter piechaudii TaxID=72556 RepID=UPI0006802E85|nr:sensor histidine kinase [Achromobacter piechaudii]KNY04247.1 histidine kinase [Achromobacter piechaudii]